MQDSETSSSDILKIKCKDSFVSGLLGVATTKANNHVESLFAKGTTIVLRMELLTTGQSVIPFKLFY